MMQMNLMELLPAGKYFIGDCCYVLDDEVYHGVWGKQLNYQTGTFDVQGKRVAVAGTATGDGWFRGSDGVDYSVDSGTIAIVPFELCVKCTEEEAKELGCVHTFDHEVQFHVADGVLEIASKNKYIRINTNEPGGDGSEDNDNNDNNDDDGDDDSDDEVTLSIDVQKEGELYAKQLMDKCEGDLAEALSLILKVHKGMA